MAGQTEHHDLSEGGRTPDAVLALTRRLLAELHPGVAWIRPITLDSALEQDLGLDSLSRVELAVRIERACAATLPEQALGGAVTLRDLLNALQGAPRASSAATDAARPARWSEPAQAVPEDAETLIETLAWHARAHPDRVHIVHLGDSGETNISYADPQREVDIVATGLQRASLEPRRTAAIMLPTCAEHLHTYFGIPRADGSPVPMFPPARPSQIEQHVRRHAGILCNAETSVLVTVPEARGVARQLEGRVPGLRRVAPGAELKDYGREPLPVPIGRDDIAFIQYISGSTGDPKGLMLTHANLMAQSRVATSGQADAVLDRDKDHSLARVPQQRQPSTESSPANRASDTRISRSATIVRNSALPLIMRKAA